MLLVTPGRETAIDNIRKAVAEGRFNDAVEPFDPDISPQALKADILDYVSKLESASYKLKRFAARTIVDIWCRLWSDGINEIVGAERLPDGPAFITSNHFNPFDNGILRRLSKDSGHGRLVAVSQGKNFVMPGLNGFVLRNIDLIPIISEPSYMGGKFLSLMHSHLDAGRLILIYPEQQMWFNYRKPRPGKRGAYLFAARMGVPLVPAFVQMEEIPGKEIAPGFNDVKLILHVLDPIFPDRFLSERENSFRMCKLDYEAKVRCYEKCYGKPLNYDFTPWDIAGWTGG